MDRISLKLESKRLLSSHFPFFCDLIFTRDYFTVWQFLCQFND